MKPGEERELVNAVFAAGLVILAIFLGFVGVLAAVQPTVEKVSFLRDRFLISVWASFAGVVLSGGASGLALAYLSGCRIDIRYIVWPIYLLIGVVIVASLSLIWALGLI
jgi:hypothetical protein